MKVFTTIIGVFGVAFGMILLFTLPVYWLWNWLMPDIFGLKVISLLRARELSTNME